MDYTSARGSDYTDYRGMQVHVPTLFLFSDLLLAFVKEAETVSGGLDEATTMMLGESHPKLEFGLDGGGAQYAPLMGVAYTAASSKFLNT